MSAGAMRATDCFRNDDPDQDLRQRFNAPRYALAPPPRPVCADSSSPPARDSPAVAGPVWCQSAPALEWHVREERTLQKWLSVFGPDRAKAFRFALVAPRTVFSKTGRPARPVRQGAESNQFL